MRRSFLGDRRRRIRVLRRSSRGNISVCVARWCSNSRWHWRGYVRCARCDCRRLQDVNLPKLAAEVEEEHIQQGGRECYHSSQHRGLCLALLRWTLAVAAAAVGKLVLRLCWKKDPERPRWGYSVETLCSLNKEGTQFWLLGRD